MLAVLRKKSAIAVEKNHTRILKLRKCVNDVTYSKSCVTVLGLKRNTFDCTINTWEL